MRVFSRVVFFILLATFFCSSLGVMGSSLVDANPSAVAVSRTIFVDAAGGGNFRTIQSAIDSIPANNNNWITIHVKAGTYWELVSIPMDKPFIVLEGEGSSTTTIVWNGSIDVMTNATFSSYAPNFVAKWITFKNSYNDGNKILEQGTAALVAGDKSSFYECSFIGVQDTLFDYLGRHYFKSCYIEGYVDFIFGNGQSIYENCVISTTQSGYITAQGRTSEIDPSGFVFKYCQVKGNGKSYLGRAWRSHARVIFYQTSMVDVIVPEGWDAWQQKGSEGNFVYAEEGCYGLGADTSKRVLWEKKLSSSEVAQYVSLDFIDKEGWLQQQP